MSDISWRVAEACGWRDIAMRPAKVGFYDTEALTGMPPVDRIDEWKRQQTEHGSSVYWELPDYEHDVAAGIAALEQTGKQWTLRNYEDMTFSRIFVCEIDAHEATGESPALAICQALLAWAKARET